MWHFGSLEGGGRGCCLRLCGSIGLFLGGGRSLCTAGCSAGTVGGYDVLAFCCSELLDPCGHFGLSGGGFCGDGHFS